MNSKFIFCLLILALTAACAAPPAAETASPPPATPTLTATPLLSPTPAKPLTILILPASMAEEDYETYQQYEKLIYDLAQEGGMRFQVRHTLSVDELQAELPALKVVIALPPDPGLAALAAAAPDVQFLAVNIPDLPAAANLSIVGSGGLPVDRQAFLAGYIAGMLAPEWRVGILSVDTPEGNLAAEAFANGYHFYCGNCRNPNFAQPAYNYPVSQIMPADTPESQYPAHAAVLLRYYARVAYVYPPLATPDVLYYLAQYGMNLIGQDAPSDDVRDCWVVSIQPDLIVAIQNIFPELVAGRGGQVVPTPLFLTNIGSHLLSEGKLRLVQEILDGLQNGTIDTGVGGD